VFKVAAFNRLYLARMDEFSKSLFQPERLQRQVDEIAAAIRSAVEEESVDKLKRFDQAVAGKAVSARPFGGFPFAPAPRPIKAFVGPRTQSVIDQLAGVSQGTAPARLPFGGGPGGPGEFGPGMMAAGPFLTALDRDKSGSLSREEFVQGFARWFAQWAKAPGAGLSEEDLRAGLNQELPMFPPMGGFGAPGGTPSREP
jgi:hypothetical protein